MMKIKILCFLIAVTTAAIVALAFWKLDSSRQALFQSRARLRVAYQASEIRSRLESGINRRLALAEGLAAYAAARPDMNRLEFESFARVLIAGDTVIQSVDVVKNSTVSYIYPISGNEGAIGFDVLKNPEQRPAAERAVLTKRTILAGPVRLVQGGTVCIGRVPIFRMQSGKSSEGSTYWGMSSILIKPEGLFRESGLLEHLRTLRFALRGKDGRGEKGDVFFGDESVFKAHPVLLNISFKSGSWQMAVVPIGGWTEIITGSWKMRAFGVLMSILTGVLIYVIIASWFPKRRLNY